MRNVVWKRGHSCLRQLSRCLSFECFACPRSLDRLQRPTALPADFRPPTFRSVDRAARRSPRAGTPRRCCCSGRRAHSCRPYSRRQCLPFWRESCRARRPSRRPSCAGCPGRCARAASARAGPPGDCGHCCGCC